MVDNRVTSHCYFHLACNACRFSIKCITGVTSSCNNKLANNGSITSKSISDKETKNQGSSFPKPRKLSLLNDIMTSSLTSKTFLKIF